MKRHLKRAAENIISSIAPLVWRAQRTPRLLVLMYHRVLPPQHPDVKTEQPGMHVSPQTLAMHLNVLEEQGFEFVHMDDWLSGTAKGQAVPARACAITFDDGWRDNYDHAYPILKKARTPATIYLVSDLVGTQYSFWPNSLARMLTTIDETTLSRLPDWLHRIICDARGGADAGALDVAQIDEVILACKATHSDADMLSIVRQFEERESSSPEAARDLMSWAEIQEMNADGLIRFGSHTRRHTRLSDVASADALQDEIIGSRQAIGQQLGATPQTFCYPNGDTSAQAIAVVRSAYQGAVTTQKGWHSPHDDPFLIRRIGVHEDISNRPASFLAHISGWL